MRSTLSIYLYTNDYLTNINTLGGTEVTTLNAIEGNTFTDCDEGIGLGEGVSSTLVEDDKLITYLQENNDFVSCTDDVNDYRPE